MSQYDPSHNEEMFGDLVAELIAFEEEMTFEFANANELGLVVPAPDPDRLPWEEERYDFVPDDAA